MSIDVGSTLIGVAMGVTGGIVQSFGFIFQKKAHNQINDENKDKTKPFQKSVLTKWIWWLGIIVYTIGGTLDSTALNYAPQSILSPISALKLGTIALLSWCILKEKIGIKDIIAIIVIIAGVVMVVLFGPEGNSGDIDIITLKDLFQGIPYLVLVAILVGMLCANFHSS